MRKRLTICILLLILIGNTAPAWAACRTHTYTIGGRFMTCTECCYGAVCNTHCF